MEFTGCTSNANYDKKSVRVIASVGSLGSLQEIAKLMPQEHRKPFNRKYGRLLDLLFIQVDENALTSLAQYWNSSLRCFEFPTFDITPTIEEYACVLDIPMKERDTYYFPMDQPLTESKVLAQFKELLGLSEKQSRISGHTGSRGLNRACLEDRMMFLAQKNEWEGFSTVLALTIYGLVLFSSATDIIDLAAMDVFYSMENKNRNPVPAILAETFLTLTFSHQKGKGKLHCCLQLLYVWAMSHLHVGEQIRRGSKALDVFNYLTIKSHDERGWKEEFESAEENMFLRWVSPWYDSKKGKVIIFSCGEFPNVPLMGPKGCITYTPVVVLKQFGWTQRKPHLEEIAGFHFWYKDDTRATLKKVKEAWKSVRWMGKEELGNLLVADAQMYKAWRNARGVHSHLSAEPSREKEDFSSAHEMVEQADLYKTQVEKLLEEKQDAHDEIDYQKRKYEALRISKSLLERDYEETTTSLRKGKAVMTSGGMRKMKGKMESLSQENDDHWKEKFMAEKRARERLEKENRKEKQEFHRLQGEYQVEKTIRKELEYSYDHLETQLNQAKLERSKAYDESIRVLHQSEVLAEDLKRSQREKSQKEAKAREWEMKCQEQKHETRKWGWLYQTVMDGLNEQAPVFIDHWEEAEIDRANPCKVFPPGINGLVDYCGGIARGLKRKMN